ncbi:hypothetical protein OAK22_01800 [Nitrosopumilus sp.]|nr:hypothetical protein [Nitrosopumilus sp.]
MIQDKEWINQQKTESEISDNFQLLKKIKANSGNKLDDNFELVVDRLFMAMGNFEKIEAYIALDENMEPRNFAPGNSYRSQGRDGLVSYPDFELVLEATRRPLAHTAHWDHLEDKPEKKQLGIIVILNINNSDPNLWLKNKSTLDQKNKFFHLCDADFLFKLLKDQPNAFSKFKEFLANSEKIWRDETKWLDIQTKIITLIRQE